MPANRLQALPSFPSPAPRYDAENEAQFRRDLERALLSLAPQGGVYTPVLVNVANIDSSTAYPCVWAKAGDVVIVFGKADVTPTLTATSTQLGISLPVTTSLSTAEQCAGTAACPTVSSQSAAILGDVTNDRAQMEWVSGDVTNQPMYFLFAYFVGR